MTTRIFTPLLGILVFICHSPALPVIQCGQQLLSDSQGAAADRFGFAVSISGDTLAVGSNLDDVGGLQDQGSVTIFERLGGRWEETTKITAPEISLQGNFGHSVSLEGDVLAIGAPGDNSKQGSVTLLARDLGGVGNWGEIRTLTADAGNPDDRFGSSVSLSGNTLAVGAPNDTSDDGDQLGTVYLFERNLGGTDNWGQNPSVIATENGSVYSAFATHLSLSGDTLAVAASADNIGDQGNQGSVSIYQRDTAAWRFVRKITASDGDQRDLFGSSVSLSGNTLAVGAEGFGGDSNLSTFQGTAYVFRRDEGGSEQWGEVTILDPGDAAPGDRFGSAISIHGDTIALGASRDVTTNDEDQGSVTIFTRNHGGSENWGKLRTITANGGSGGDRFGAAVDLSADALAIGAHFDDIGANSRQGSTTIVPPIPRPFAEWLALHFDPAALATPALEESLWGDLADPDRDGLVNLAEAFHGTDPNVPERPQLNPSLSDGSLHLTWVEAPECFGVLAEIKWSADLASWFDSGDGLAPVARTITLENRSAQLSTVSGETGFLRLEFTR